MKTILLTLLLITLPVSATFGESLRWTAPGDDGNEGTATEYDLRVSTEPITVLNWASTTQIEGEPVPSVAGTREVFHYYFAMITGDEAENWSGLSNVVVVPFDPEVFDPMMADFNGDGQLDISDLMILIDYMFVQEN